MRNFILLISQFTGKFDGHLKALLMVLILDFITGLIKAIKTKKLSSAFGFKGIIKKVGYLIIISLSFIIDKILGDSGAVRTMVIYFFIANEGISILENWKAMGLPLPNRLYNAFEDLKNKDE